MSKSLFVKVAQAHQNALDQLLNLKNAPLGLKPTSEELTRQEMVVSLFNTYQHFQSSFLIHPRPVKFDLEKLKKQNDPAVLSQCQTLIEWGLVPPSSPLVTSNSKFLNPKQVGANLGYFYSQLAWLTHQPSFKFSPKLMSQG